MKHGHGKVSAVAVLETGTHHGYATCPHFFFFFGMGHGRNMATKSEK